MPLSGSRSPSGRVTGTARWRVVRRQVLDAAKWRCVKCGRPGALEVHHLTPVSAGGAWFDENNLAAVCKSCHIAIHRDHARRPSAEAKRWRRSVEELASADVEVSETHDPDR